MSMKKKFLALALAGMVAMPVVANATSANNSQTIGAGINEAAPTANVRVNGTVSKADGTAAAGRIEVQLPTAMAFAVDKDGGVITSSNYEVRNTGSEPVKVEILEFIEDNANGGITIAENNTGLAAKTRDNVYLTLTGDSAINLYQAKTAKQTLFAKINPSDVKTATLRGEAGTTTGGTTTTDTVGVNESFTIRFQISKA